MTTSSGADGGDDNIALDPDVDPIDPVEAGPLEPVRDGGGRARGVVAGVLGVLAILVLTVTAVAVWAKATVFDSEKVATIVGDALEEPEVQVALADYLTEQVFTLVDVDAFLTEALPNRLQQIEPVIASGVRSAVEVGISRILANPDVQRVLEQAVERAHSRAMQLLEGDGLVDGITVTDGEVTVNFLPLIGRGFARLQSLGLFTDVELPELTPDGDPDEQIAALSQATGRDVPAGFGQLVVYRSDTLADGQASLQNAQRMFSLAKRAVWALVALTVVLIVATVLIARHRWRATLLLGLGAAVAMVITRSIVHRVVDEAPTLAVRPGGRAAISAIVGGASTGLLRLAGVVLIIAVLATVVALFRRHWRRSDLVLVAAVLIGVAVVAVLGITIVSLVLGIVLAVAVVFLARRILPAGPALNPA